MPVTAAKLGMFLVVVQSLTTADEIIESVKHDCVSYPTFM